MPGLVQVGRLAPFNQLPDWATEVQLSQLTVGQHASCLKCPTEASLLPVPEKKRKKTAVWQASR